MRAHHAPIVGRRQGHTIPDGPHSALVRSPSPGSVSDSTYPRAAELASRPSTLHRTLPAAAAAVVTALVVGAAVWLLKPSGDATRPAVTRSVIAESPFDRRPSAGTGTVRSTQRWQRHAVAISPDGRNAGLSRADRQWAASGPTGHLVFMRRGTLMAAGFDPAQRNLTAGGVTLVDGVIQIVRIRCAH